jgi:predicted RNA-binding protein YlxR (DUF448 family)
MVRVTFAKEDSRFSVNQAPFLQGRSAYACTNRACLEAALRGKKFQRALKRTIPDDIVGYLNTLLEGFEK